MQTAQNDPSHDDPVRALHDSLSEVGATLAHISAELADQAVLLAVGPEDAALDVPAALNRGVPLAIPESGIEPAARLGDSAAPVARSAPLASDALRAFAPATAG